MTSIHTNIGAQAALQTLRSISRQISSVQREISTGFRIDAASDGAAYWSISATMRSDKQAISAVRDALALGGAMVDATYSGMTSVVDVVNEFKGKLVAAMSTGIDKAKIQVELAQLSKRATDIAQSSTFSGDNWLKTDVPSYLQAVDQFKAGVPAAFIRSGGTVSVEMINVDLKPISLFNAGGGGALQKELDGLGSIGGFRETNVVTAAHNGHEDHVFTGPATFGTSDRVAFDLIIDRSVHSAGATHRITIDKTLIDAALGTSNGVIASAADMRRVLETAFQNGNVPATATSATHAYWAGNRPDIFEIGSFETSGHDGSSIEINVVHSDFGPSALGLGDPYEHLDHDNMYPTIPVGFDEPFTVSGKAEFYFDVRVASGALTTVTVNRATVNAALGTTDGYVGSASDFAAVLTYAAQGKGIVATADGNQIIFGADQTLYPEAGNRAAPIYVGNVRDNLGYVLEFDLAEINITQQEFSLAEYLVGVEYMLERVINATSTLGTLRSHITNRTDILSQHADILTSSIGHLVDADLEEASSRLKALQAQEQLALQALSIANSSSQNIIRLLR